MPETDITSGNNKNTYNIAPMESLYRKIPLELVYRKMPSHHTKTVTLALLRWLWAAKTSLGRLQATNGTGEFK
ncbi:unnamed protein product [Dovyalis caffra]|uniref:Uncharacterized protein n=1 Tax=Dovyalis caffra TaxID=77055 RepID=A0AAV1QQK3_9ROSI|nr:unnamed protein product [Dovyalis caffra]